MSACSVCERYQCPGCLGAAFDKIDRQNAELSALRAKVAELESEVRAYEAAGDAQEAMLVGVLAPIGDESIAEAARRVVTERDAARRDLEAAKCFGIGLYIVANVHAAEWTLSKVGRDPMNPKDDRKEFSNRDAALAEARRLAGIT